MSKKFFAILLSVMLIFSLVACGGDTQGEPDEGDLDEVATWTPNRPISIVVPYAPGGAIDQVMRTLQPMLAENLGVSVTINNIPDGSTVVAYEHVASADKDGYTIMAISPEVGLNAVLGTSDLVPSSWAGIGFGAAFPNTIAVHKDSPYETMDDLFATLASGKNLTCGTAANGDAWTQSYLLLAQLTGNDGHLPTFIPQGGGFPAAQAVMKKEIDFASCGLPEVLDLLPGGDLRLLGYFGIDPYEAEGYGTVEPFSKEIPGAAEYSPNGGWCGLAVLNGTDQAIVDRLCEAYEYAATHPDFTNFLEENSFIGNVLVGKDFQDNMDLRAWTAASLIYSVGITSVAPEEVGIFEP